MPLAKEVKEYSVRIYLSPGESTRERAEIWFKDDQKRGAGRIYFVESDIEPGMDFVDRGGNPVIHLPFSMFGSVMDIVRNEKPLYFGDSFLSTTNEPVGENE